MPRNRRRVHHSDSQPQMRLLVSSAKKVIEDYRQGYLNDLKAKEDDDWLRNIATSCLVYYSITGSIQKTEAFAEGLAKELLSNKSVETSELVGRLCELTGIELEVE